MRGLFLLSIFAVGACGVNHTHKAPDGVQAEVTMIYPATELCFEDDRITTFDELERCLEIVTGYDVTVTVEGEIKGLPGVLYGN